MKNVMYSSYELCERWSCKLGYRQASEGLLLLPELKLCREQPLQLFRHAVVLIRRGDHIGRGFDLRHRIAHGHAAARPRRSAAPEGEPRTGRPGYEETPARRE